MDRVNHAASVSEVRQAVTPQRVSVFGHYELQRDGVNHAASVSDVQQVVALKCDRVFGYYGREEITMRIKTKITTEYGRIRSIDQSKPMSPPFFLCAPIAVIPLACSHAT
jgi:hypothetical protein